MANLLSNTTIGGYQSIHTGNIGSYAITSLSGYATQSYVTSQGYITNTNPYYYVNPGAGNGIGFWTQAPTTYGITMAHTSAGYGAINDNSEYYLYFSITNGGNRGFIFRNDYGAIAQLASTGWLMTRGEIYPGYNNGGGGGQTSYYIYGNTNSGGIRTNGNWIVNGDIYLGTRDAWLSSWLNQSVRSDGNPTFASIYLNGTQLTGTQTQQLKNTLDITGLPYKCDIVINGDPDTFYPVHFIWGNQDVWRRIIINRGYSEQAPWDPIGTGAHHGGLLLDWEGNFGGWGGAEYSDRLRVFNQSYTDVCADMYIYTHSMGYVFMLRGGGTTGALYHIYSDQEIRGYNQVGTPDIAYNTSTLFYDHSIVGYRVYAPAPLTLAQVNSSRIDGLRTKKQSLLDNRYLRQGVDISGIGTVTATNFLANNAFYLNGTSYYLNATDGGVYSNVQIRSGTQMKAPIFYDTDTNYYLDLNATTSLRTVGSWRSDSSTWDGEFSGKIQYHSSNWYIQAADSLLYRNAGGTNVFLVNQAGDATAVGSMRSPIFYDSNDTSYYVDPNGTSVLNYLTLNAAESMGVYGIRGKFTNEYIHLYSKVGVGHPGGWGMGESNTPVQGFSTYGGATIAYGNSAGMTVYGNITTDSYVLANYNVRVGEIWGQAGLYRSSGHMMFGTEGGHWYFQSSNNTRVQISQSDGNIWMGWANDWLSNLLAAKQNASTAITTSNIGSQSVSYATTAGALSSMNISQFTNNSGYFINSTSNIVYVNQVGFSQTNYDFTLAPRQSIGSMSIKLWDNYFNNSGLGSDYGSLLDIYGRSGHVHSQFYMDANSTLYYRMAAYAGGWNGWQQMWTSTSLTNLSQLTNGPGYITSSALSGYATQSYVNSQGFLTSVPAQSQLISPNGATVVAADAAMPNAGHSFIHSLALGPGGNDGHILGMTWAGTTSIYGAQIFLDTDPNDIMAIRSRSSSGVWTSWKTVYHTGNFTNNSSNWDSAYSWGNHASAGYLTSLPSHNHDDRYYTEGESDGRYAYKAGAAGQDFSADRLSSYYLRNHYGVSTDHSYGMYFDNGLSSAYGIYRESGAWDHPYPDLRIAFHTGIKLGANSGYNGIRFYTDYDMTTQVMSVNNGSDGLGGGNVYVNNSLQAGSSLRAPIFYDSNDTNYYGDFNGTSKFYQAIIFGDSTRYSAVSTTINGTGAGDKLILYGNASNYDARVMVGTDYDVIFKSQGEPAGKGMFRFYSGPSAALAMEIRADQNTNVTGTIYSAAYRGNANVGGTGTASWHPDGIYCGSTMWQYGTMYKNNTGIYGVSEIQLNAGLYLQTYNDRNLIVKGNSSSDAGIEGRNAAGSNVFQIYGSGSDYGFLNGTWAAWDIRKTKNGALYMNDTSGYYLYTNGTSNFYALNIQGSAVIHAGNIGSQSVSYASSAGSVAWGNVSSRPTALSQFTNDLGNYGGWITSSGSITGNASKLDPLSGDSNYKLAYTADGARTNAGEWGRAVMYYVPNGQTYGIRVDRADYADSAGGVAWTNVSSRPTALSQFSNDLGNYGGWLTTGGKAADSELLDGIDSSRIVFGDGARASTYVSSMDDPNQKSGFFFKDSPTGQPFGDWWNWMTVAGNSWQSSNNYSFQIAHAFHSDDAYIRRMTAGTAYSWRTLITSGNIGSQSVNYANSAGSASSATTATVASQLNKFGDIYGQDWNSYYIQDKFIAAAVYGHSGANRPVTTYDYGVALSYGEASGPVMQMYFPENSPNLGTIFRKAHYRTGWNGNWSTWKTIVEQEGNTCTIVGGNQTGMEIHANVGYNQDPLTYFLLRGQADTSWKALKIRLTGDAGGQNIEFRRIAENGADDRMFYVPRTANQVIFDYTFVQGSDSRYKDNIIPITNSLDKVKSLRGVEFDWNSGVNEGTHDVGLIAQEVEAVLPEAVTTQEDGYKNLAYTKVIPLLVEAMKEQQAMIDALKAEIELLKNR